MQVKYWGILTSATPAALTPMQNGRSHSTPGSCSAHMLRSLILNVTLSTLLATELLPRGADGRGAIRGNGHNAPSVTLS